MTKKTEKSWTRRITAFALMATLLATGGAVATQSASGSVADGIPRCCF